MEYKTQKLSDQTDLRIGISDSLKSGRIEILKVICVDMGVDYQQLINKLNYSNDQLSISQLIDYLSHSGVNPEPFLKVFCSLFDYTPIKMQINKAERFDELHQKLSIVVKEMGDVASELSAATKDGTLTKSELASFKKEILDCVSALAGLQAQFEKTLSKQATKKISKINQL